MSVAMLHARIKVGGSTVDEDERWVIRGDHTVLTMSFLCVVVKALEENDEVTAAVGFPVQAGMGITGGTISEAALTAIKLADVEP